MAGPEPRKKAFNFFLQNLPRICAHQGHEKKGNGHQLRKLLKGYTHFSWSHLRKCIENCEGMCVLMSGSAKDECLPNVGCSLLSRAFHLIITTDIYLDFHSTKQAL